jgi:hypothetical protein
MPWIRATGEDVISEFTPSEQSAIAGMVEDNTINAIVTRTTMEVRDAVQSGGYPLDADEDSIPGGLVNALISIARWRLLVSAPSFKQLQTEERHDLYKDALEKLALIAQRKVVPELPPAEVPPGFANWNSENKFPMRTHPVPKQSGGAYANPNAPEDIT